MKKKRQMSFGQFLKRLFRVSGFRRRACKVIEQKNNGTKRPHNDEETRKSTRVSACRVGR